MIKSILNSKNIGIHVPKIAYATKTGITTCKECSNGNSDIFEINAVNGFINRLKIKCRYYGRNGINDDSKNNGGCKWTGYVKELNHHLKHCSHKLIYSNKYPKIYQKTHQNSDVENISCPFKEYGCDYSDINQDNIDEHLESSNISHYLMKIDFDNDHIKHRINTLNNKINNIDKDLNVRIKNIEKEIHSPNKPNICYERNGKLIDIFIDNNIDKSVVEYELKYLKIPTKYKNCNNYLSLLGKLDNDDHKINWNTIHIKYNNTKIVQRYRITNIDVINSKYIIGVSSKNNYGISTSNFIIPSFKNIFLSNILTTNNIGCNRLVELLQKQLNKNIRLTQIYSGKEHGFLAANFHSHCDNKGSTVVLIQSNHNHIFGGYTAISWKKESKSYKDSTAFLFKLYPDQAIYNLTDKNSIDAINHRPSYMACFGDGFTVGIGDKCNSHNNNYVYGGYTYNFKYGSQLVGGNSAVRSYFKVINIEVFKVDH